MRAAAAAHAACPRLRQPDRTRVHRPGPTGAVVFCIWVLPWVGQHISWALVAISGVLIVLSISMLAATALKDPGFIPRSPLDDDVEYGCGCGGAAFLPEQHSRRSRALSALAGNAAAGLGYALAGR